MKTPGLIGYVEDTASTQVNRLLDAAKKRYDRFMRSAGKATAAEQKRYLRAAEQTVAGAEKTIRELKKKIAQAKRALGAGSKKAKRAVRKTARNVGARKKRS
jgi:ABC-type transporter Mla subunit MlaD